MELADQKVKTHEANSQVQILDEKLHQMTERESDFRGQFTALTNEIKFKDQQLDDLQARINCGQTDDVVYRSKIKQLEFDLGQSNSKTTLLQSENQILSVQFEELKHVERDQSLKVELLTNQVQSTNRQLTTKVHEHKLSHETITKQHSGYSMLLKETDQQIREKDSEIEKLR